MTTFIENVLHDLQKKGYSFSKLQFILPSKRAGTFLKHFLSKITDKPILSPEIYSIEEFVGELSQLKTIGNIELLFELYDNYIKIQGKKEKHSFDEFAKWAQILIQDFNEIDRYLIDENHVFDYLSAIKEINHWSKSEDKTEMVKNYLDFWKNLKKYYTSFRDNLLKKQKAYQGLAYREAVENIQNYIENNTTKTHIFLGFNALNTAEETIIQEIVQNSLGLVYWDTESTFFNSKNHDAGLFIREYAKHWKYFQNQKFNWISDNYAKPKNINVIGIPKNIGQAKHIGSILNNLKDQNTNLNSTAVILSDESLLLPVLNAIPEHIHALNITMGLPLNTVPLATLFEKLFYIQLKKNKSVYYKDVITILTHDAISPLFNYKSNNAVERIVNTIKTNNIFYLDEKQLSKMAPKQEELTSLLFGNWLDSANKGLNNCQALIYELKAYYDKDKTNNLLNLEHLYKFHELFNEIANLNDTYGHIKNLATLHSVYKELLSSQTLDFKGEPLEGLQIMGMLESRVLDFETVIIASVNEGILPSGKTQNSFIPFDVKVEYNLPTYKEKDAVYAYHFYKLLHRAKNVFILYNTEIDTIYGGEKSRFIKQLELEGIHKINHVLVAPDVPVINHKPNEVIKTPEVIEAIKNIAEKGFSPSSLTSYIRNPIDFYYQKILKIKEYDNVEETVAANTLGTVIHNTLESFYRPFIGKTIKESDIKDMKKIISNTVANHFKDVYKDGDLSKGKNLIIFEIAKRYISNFLDMEIKDLKNGNTIEILAIEKESHISLKIPELEFPVVLKGTVDRIDKRNGQIRVIDYKTGKVEKTKVEIVNWEDITTHYDKYSKSFQILSYALMMSYPNSITTPIEAGIISFKNLSAGFLKFAKKDKAGAYAQKIELIDQVILDDFYNELKQLIIEICNPVVPFIEKEIK